MKRRHFVELEDLSWWPRVFRDAATDYLVTAIRSTKAYDGMIPKLADAVRRSHATAITDLCSGGGGPWEDLYPALQSAEMNVPIFLTDKFPNIEALSRVAAATPGMSFESAPVSAMEVPAHLAGFRTLFSSFHHFPPDAAEHILAAAVRDRQGIAIAEATARSPFALMMMLFVPLAVWMMTPRIRPFRWSRLLWTYLIPIIPVATMFDGIVSCLRTYTPGEMQAMGHKVSGDSYLWEAGYHSGPGSLISMPYLIGSPRE